MATITELAPTPALPAEPPSARDERISFKRLLWVGPLTVAAALAATYAIGLALRALDPSLSRMGQLGPPLLLLTAEGAIGAVIVFALMGAALRRPIFWFRVIGAAVLAVSILPDLALGLGGSTAMLGMRAMGPFLSVGMPGPSGPPPGGRPPGGGPPGGFVFPAMPLEHVAILVLLHVVVAAICIVMLTTLARDGIRPADAVGESTAGG